MTPNEQRVGKTPPQHQTGDAARFWDEHYHGWGPATVDVVNPVLAEVAASLTAGTALDLGCGAGGASGSHETAGS